MLMDLNHFKEINDTLGHHQGDRLLQEVATRLRATVRASDTVARLGGDEFGILLHGTDRPRRRHDRRRDGARRGCASRSSSTRRTLQVGGSIGLAWCPEHGADVETLLQRADIAMYAAKSTSGGYAVFERSQDHHSPRRLQLAAALPGGDRPRRAAARLPAEGRPAHGADRRRRGARALGASGAGRRRAVRVRADRRADRPDHRAHHRRAGVGARARRLLARARPRPVDRGQPVGALVPRRAPGGRDPRAARRARPPAGLPGAGDHRVDADARPEPRRRSRSSGWPQSASGCRSTTSAPATRRSPTSSGCPSTRSRSTSRSCST